MGWAAAIPAISAGVSAIGGLVGDAMSASSAGSINQKTMNFDADMMRQQEAFQAQQSATAVQTRMKDIKAAGLNPALAVGFGGAPAAQAMSGSAPTAQLQNPGAAYGNLGSQISSAAQVGFNGAQVSSNVGLQSAQGANARADAALKAAQAFKLANVDTDVAKAQVTNLLQGAKTSESQAVLNQSNVALNQVKQDSERAYQQLTGAQAAVARATVPVLGAQVQQLLSSRDLNEANAALSRISAVGGRLNNMQVTAAMGDVLSNIHNTAQLSGLKVPLEQALANWAKSPAGKASPYIQQVQSIVGTIRSFIPFTGGAGTPAPGFSMSLSQ